MRQPTMFCWLRCSWPFADVLIAWRWKRRGRVIIVASILLLQSVEALVNWTVAPTARPAFLSDGTAVSVGLAADGSRRQNVLTAQSLKRSRYGLRLNEAGSEPAPWSLPNWRVRQRRVRFAIGKTSIASSTFAVSLAYTEEQGDGDTTQARDARCWPRRLVGPTCATTAKALAGEALQLSRRRAPRWSMRASRLKCMWLICRRKRRHRSPSNRHMSRWLRPLSAL